MSPGTITGRILEKELAKAAKKIKNPEAKAAFAELIKRGIRRPLPSGRSGPRKKGPGKLGGLPSRLLDRLRSAPFDPEAAIRIAIVTYEKWRPGFGKRFAKVWLALHDEHADITRSTNWAHFLHTMFENEGKALSRDEYENLLDLLVYKATEGAVLDHPEVLARFEAGARRMEKLAANPQRLERLRLASLDPTPRIVTTVHAPGRSGPTEARQPYVDVLVVFEGTDRSHAEASRWVVGAKVQVKQWGVHKLVRHVDKGDKPQLGQLLNDRMRGPRGGWRFEEVRVPREQIVDDPRLRELLSVGFRDFTDAERAALAKDGINVTHLIHQFAAESFYAWGRRALKEMGITVAKQ